MSLTAKVSPDSTELLVEVPPTRSDVLHACDVMEDAAIAYNFNKIKETTPKLSTIAVQLPINKLGDMMRKEIAFAGFTEVLAFTLVLTLNPVLTRRELCISQQTRHE
jgi:phenylalanyl-tRNA synthetase beta chain